MKIGFIGLGLMGNGIATNLLNAGNEMTVYDIRKEAAVPVLERGAKWAGSPKEVARSCQVVISSLPAPPDVEQMVYGTDGLKSGWKAGDIYVDMSTNSPSTIRRIARDAGEMGVSVLDAPVSGGTLGAEKGTLAVMVGGDSATLEKVRKVLETMGQKIFPVGDVGCGNVAKLINNMIALANASISVFLILLAAKIPFLARKC